MSSAIERAGRGEEQEAAPRPCCRAAHASLAPRPLPPPPPRFTGAAADGEPFPVRFLLPKRVCSFPVIVVEEGVFVSCDCC